MNKHIQDLASHLATLQAFGAKYNLDLPDDLTTVSISGELPQINIYPRYAPNDAGEEKVLALVGVAFSSHGWTAKPGYDGVSYDWVKELDGVRLVVHDAEKLPRLQPRPVPTNMFPILLEDVGDKCDVCHKCKPDVTEREDPYAKDVHNESNLINVCDECYDNLAADI